MHSRQGIEYASPNGVPLLLDVFMPTDPGPHPGVILIHGGGWVTGGRGEARSAGAELARLGFVAFSVDYRLAPRVSLSRSLAGRAGPLDNGARVRVVVSWSGPTDLSQLVGVNVGGASHFVDAFATCPGPSCAHNLRRASPVTHVDGTDAATFIANADKEFIPLAQAQEMANTLQLSAVPYQLATVPGSQHSVGYAMTELPSLHETVFQASVAFLKKWIGQKRR